VPVDRHLVVPGVDLDVVVPRERLVAVVRVLCALLHLAHAPVERGEDRYAGRLFAEAADDDVLAGVTVVGTGPAPGVAQAGISEVDRVRQVEVAVEAAALRPEADALAAGRARERDPFELAQLRGEWRFACWRA